LRTNIVLIDFESVQPEALVALDQDHFRVIVFVGACQSKVPFEIAAALQRLGSKAEYIKISGNGPNALDFHIAFYIGQFAAADPTAYFHIVSKDTGFDPLVQHLKTKKIFANRVMDVSAIPLIKSAQPKTPGERLEIVLSKLNQLKAAKPRTVKTLSTTIATLFRKQLSEEEVALVVRALQAQGIITVKENKLAYSLPDSG
jgi:hypothetical protein